MPPTYYRKVIRITAEDSPNVRLALTQRANGQMPTGEVILPGVLPWMDYQVRRAMWDSVRQCIGLDARFYEGAEVLLFPPEWLNLAERRSDELERGVGRRTAKAIGIDPAEGGDRTAMAAVDEYGLIELVSKKTPNTATIGNEAVAFMRKWGVEPERVYFDRGGGGRQIADRIRDDHGLDVQSVGFGEGVSAPIGYGGGRSHIERVADTEDRYAYKNRRAQMYGELRLMLDPSLAEGESFAIPREYARLREQLAPIPLLYDPEGRLYLPPKNKRSPTSTEITLVDIIGYSPDEADALVLAVHALLHEERAAVAGTF